MGLNGYSSVLNSFFITFRIPLFFFICVFIGYKAIEKWNLKYYLQNLKKKAVVQILPATLFYIIYCLAFSKKAFGFLVNGWSLYWFTIVLLEMFIVYYTISLIASHLADKLVDIFLILISLLG